jgi:IS30 family transposase
MYQSTVGTLVDRTSRYVRMVHLPADHDAQAVHDGLTELPAGLLAAARLTLNWDQGSEMSPHDRIAPLLRDGVFFAHPGQPVATRRKREQRAAAPGAETYATRRYS